LRKHLRSQREGIIIRRGYLVSKYICNPHLFNDYKYDLRIYVLITSFDPLKIYIHKNGLVRFATQKYDLQPKLCSKRFIHLTNFAINKKNSKFHYNEEANVYVNIR
jgi:tubulin polyglutamylase TTLL4